MIKSNLSKARCAIAAALSLMLSGAAIAADGPAKKTDTTAPYGTLDWGGFGWGVGVAANFDVKGGRVATATTPNNIVRIEDASSNVNLGFVLEAHYFLREWGFLNTTGRKGDCSKTTGDPWCMQVATGPFVAIVVGGGSTAKPAADGLVTAYALGWMVGLRHPHLMTSDTQSWNLGVGLRVDPGAKVLGDGIVINQPLPAGETTVRYKTEPRLGVMLLSSFSF